MAGTRLLSGAMALLVLCCSFVIISSAALYYEDYDESSASSNSSSSVNMSAICGLVPNGLFLADTDNCGYYYSCNNGAATIQYCTGTNYFSKDSQQCLPQSQVVCVSTNNANPCMGANIGSWAAVPGSCNSFYYCSNTGPELGNCPSGENFNPYVQACQYSSSYPCSSSGTGDSTGGTTTSSINLCDYVENGIYFGSPSSCAGWNYCQGNVISTGDCPTGYIYSVSNSACVQSTATTCPQLSTDPSIASSDPYLGGACNSTSNSSIAATTCENYYVCNGANYTLTTCPNNLYYDTVSAACVNRMNARNNCDRCEGSTATFVNTYSASNCTSYTYCQNSIAQFSANCPTGAFFNELAGACIAGADPDFGCCNPAYYNSTATTVATAST